METAALDVACHLVRMAAENPRQVAIYFPRHGVNPEGESEHLAITFADLNADVDVIAHGLAAAGIARGTRTALMVPPSPDFFAITFALFKIAAVPILIDPGMGIRNLGRCLAEAEPEAFIGIRRANIARRLLGWGRKTIGTTVNVGKWRLFCTTSSTRLRHPHRVQGVYPIPDVARDEPAAILFTSGSTGIAKGAVYTHGNFAAQVEILKSTYGIESGEIDLCTFPLFALFGPALGMTCVIPDMNPSRPARIDPHKAGAQIRQFRVTNLFGSPAVIRRFAGYQDEAEKTALSRSLATVRRVISAGAPASAPAIEKFVELLPKEAQVFTPYGATEALPVSNIGSGEILGETRRQTEQGKGVCVGKPVVGMNVEVIRITDEAIPEWDDSLRLPQGEVGEFVVRGPVVTRRYHNRPDATKLAKIHDRITGEVLHRMGDVGYRDSQGRLWFCGRKSHRVETPSRTLFTDMVEPIFNALPGILRTALVGVKRNGVIYPVLCVELESRPQPGGQPAIRDLLLQAARDHEHTHPIATFLFHRNFPVDVRHNSKIFREKVAVWADKKLGKNWKPEPP
jgi:acyl-CoA synthetase (AMP-forming)/AMP-acid ligase II